MTEPLDIDKIEEELKQISSWPWSYCEDDMYDKEGRNLIWSTCGSVFNNKSDLFFISNSPERIAALIDRVRELELRNRSLERSLQHKTYEQIVKLGRGSDEV